MDKKKNTASSTSRIRSAPRALVLTGFGLNCDWETTYALELAGAEAERVHINQLLMGEKIGEIARLDDYQIFAYIGGFSWGDDHGAGVIFATKLLYNIGDEILRFIEKGNLVIGICNGFQAMVNLGLLPGFDGDYRSRQVVTIVVVSVINGYILKLRPIHHVCSPKGLNIWSYRFATGRASSTPRNR
jgi:phosphoribosylformylglycinamidine (FGAM) synthase-like amidotransferase family enzyme